MPDNRNPIINLKTAGYMMASAKNISGSQNTFFDILNCSISVNTMFLNSPLTVYDIPTIRVWTPNNSECDGLYYLINPPEETHFMSGDGDAGTIDIDGYTVTTPDLTNRVWRKTSGNDIYTISFFRTTSPNTTSWKLIKNGTIVTNGSTVTVTGGTILSTYDTTSVGNHMNKTLPLSGNYTAVGGGTVNYPLIVWSSSAENINGIKILIDVFKYQDGSLYSRLYYGFTPYFPLDNQGNPTGTIRVDWGDSAPQDIDSSQHGKIVYHMYTIESTDYGDDNRVHKQFIVQVLGKLTRCVFGYNAAYGNPPYYTGTASIDNYRDGNQYWVEAEDLDETWISGHSYDKYDIVKYNNKYYISLVANNTSILSTLDRRYWRELYHKYNYSYVNNDEAGVDKISLDYQCEEFDYFYNAPNASGTGYSSVRVLIFPEFYAGVNNGSNRDTDIEDGGYSNRVQFCNWSWQSISRNEEESSSVDALINGSFMFNSCKNLSTEAYASAVVSGRTFSASAFTNVPPHLVNGDSMFMLCGSTNAVFEGNITLPSTLSNMDHMFDQCSNGVFSSISIPNSATTTNYTFNRCTSATLNNIANIGGSTSAVCMFAECTGATFSSFTSLGSTLINGSTMFSNCTNAIFSTNLSTLALPSTLVNADYMFYNCSSTATGEHTISVTTLPAGLRTADYMFYNSKFTINIEVLQSSAS